MTQTVVVCPVAALWEACRYRCGQARQFLFQVWTIGCSTKVHSKGSIRDDVVLVHRWPLVPPKCAS